MCMESRLDDDWDESWKKEKVVWLGDGINLVADLILSGNDRKFKGEVMKWCCAPVMKVKNPANYDIKT